MTTAARVFDRPFAFTIAFPCLSTYCAFCLRKPASGSQLYRCGRCRLFNYCGKRCQKDAWCDHKFECPIAADCQSAGELPPSEVFLFARILRRLRLEDMSLNSVQKDEEYLTVKQGDKTIIRGWPCLMTHAEAVNVDPDKMSYFNALYTYLLHYFNGPQCPLPDKAVIFEAFCKKIINAYSISDNRGHMIGEALDLAGSAYDHSCRPTLAVIYDGKAVTYKAFESHVDVNDTTQAFVSYTDIASSRLARQRDLKRKYYFDCTCERCLSKDDDILTSMRCANPECNQPVLITEDSEPMDIMCTGCGTCNPACAVESAQRAMRHVASFRPGDGESMFDSCAREISPARSLLHPCNIYLSDLYSMYVQQAIIRRKYCDIALAYGTEALRAMELCYQRNHKNLGFHHLKLVYLCILLQDYPTALLLVQRARDIFNFWFGPAHTYTCDVAELGRKLACTASETLKTDDLLSHLRFK